MLTIDYLKENACPGDIIVVNPLKIEQSCDLNHRILSHMKILDRRKNLLILSRKYDINTKKSMGKWTLDLGSKYNQGLVFETWGLKKENQLVTESPLFYRQQLAD